ncbi:Rna polymerase i specific transcription initiation factor rrn3 protein [Thalictrum thalictroides]|uniref:Rna polymerase i specific transcription initiation factor rrn3 protein n=1 Tax=Thalictrum thalictroides TaxID=46969 RepID=A0A7J6V5R3_THATH|nr:Rna polymerase i specific transcription initiation factor rrn3 protein [Thalictrum thalictroides]
MGMEVEFNKMEAGKLEEDLDLSDWELLQYIRKALDEVTEIEKYPNNYSELVAVFSFNSLEFLHDDQAALLVASSRALSRAVTYIDIDRHNGLLSSIFRISMWNLRAEVMDALIDLIKALAASGYVYQCLEMLVRNFKPPGNFLGSISQPHGIARKEQVHDRLHTALKDIAELMPSSRLWLNALVRQSMPRMSSKNVSLALCVYYYILLFNPNEKFPGQIVACQCSHEF